MEGTVAPEQIIINGREYDSEDVSQLIELGSKYRETEKNLNTSLDKVFPEYTKATQRNKELETELAENKKALEEYQLKQKEADEKAQTPEDVQKARKAAREMGLADVDYLKEQGYVRKEDLDLYFTDKQNQQKLVDNVIKQANVLEGEIDGSDGRVPFDQRAVLAYASAYNVADLKDAYDQMNEKANKKWKQAQLDAEERPGLTTLRPGGSKKEPQRPKFTNDNLGAAIGEWLEGLPEGQ